MTIHPCGKGKRWGAALAVVAMTAAVAPAQDEAKPTAKVASKGVLAPIAPVLPGPVVAAMQEGKYAEAIAAFDRLIADGKAPAEISYFRFLRGVAQKLDGKPDAARTALAEALKADPDGAWAAKIRFELAAVELAAGRPAEAEALARIEAESLLAVPRKDRLAEVYHAFARRLLTPDDPVTRPDPVGAYALLSKARDLAKGEATRASLLFAMGRAAQKVGQGTAQPEPTPAPNAPAATIKAPAIDAIRDFKAYLDEYPKGADRLAVRFHLGEAQLATGQNDAARLTWTDLARDIAKDAPKEALDLRAKSLYQIARTYNVPTPPEPQLPLAIAALKRALAEAPAHPRAVRAAFEIGETYRNLGRADAAIAGFEAFLRGDGFRAETDEAKRELADLTMTATFQIPQILRDQARFDEAIKAYQGYLARFPNGPQSADAQRAIIDVQLAIADDALGREKYADARAAWAAFAAQNPLDPRVPQALFQVGESFEREKKFAEATAAYESLIGKFPDSEPAAHAQFAAASILENEKGDLVAAIERFRKVAVEPWKSSAAQRIAVMESKALTVVTPRAFRSGETAHLKVATRNLETLTFSAYKINPEAYFRKKHALGDVGSLDIGLVAPDAEWTVPVPGYGKYKPVETTYDLKVAVPGIFVVKVSDEKTLQATALVVGSDLDAIVKVSRDQVLAFAQDMKTGQGRKGARVLIADPSGVILEKTTGDDGVLLSGWDRPEPFQGGPSLQYLILDGNDAAGSGLGVPDKVAQGLSARAYIYTDRPAYRPGQEVALRGVVREAKDGQYSNPAGAEYRLEVFDSRGRLLIARPTTLSPFGTFHEAVRLDPAAPVGTYRVRLSQPNRGDFSGAFEVQSYKLEKLTLDFDLPRAIVFRGENVKATLVARYQYGAPLSGRAIEAAMPDGRTVRGTTDRDGKFPVEFSTEGFGEEQSLPLVGRLPDDNVATVARVMVAIKGFNITATTPRDVYLDGESFTLTATTLDALGKPIGQELAVSVLHKVPQEGRITEREVAKKTLTTDKATGKATLTLKVDDARGGDYLVRVAGTDQFGNGVFADRPLTISGSEDETRLRILADRTAFKVGETARVNLHRRSAVNGTALLAWEADRILSYRLVPIKEGDNELTWTVDNAQFPNFTLTATGMAGQRLDEASLDVRVERDLRVTVTPTKKQIGPGEEVEVEVAAVDQLGRPVEAEVGLALVDRSLLRLFEDKLPQIGPFFYDQTRTGAFATTATNTFSDHPDTRPVSDAVVEEAERLAAQARNDASRGAVLEEAKREQMIAALPKGMADGQGQERIRDPRFRMDMAAPASPAPNFGAVGGSGLGGQGTSLGRMGGMGMGMAMPAAQPREVGVLSEMQSTDAAMIIGADKEGTAYGFPMDFSEMVLRRRSLFQIPREQYVETAYWNPSVVTGKDGKAKLTFRAPGALSEYVFSARGVTGADTLVGQATAEIAIRKDFFVDLKRPAALSQGDKPRFAARVHHAGLKGVVTLSLTVYAGGREQVYPRTLELKDDGVDEVAFEPFEVPDDTAVRLTLKAAIGDESDELTAEIPVRPWGVQALASASGTASDDATAFVALPAGRTYEDLEMIIVVSPTLRRLLIELALGQDVYPLFDSPQNRCIWPPPSPTTADRASDLLAAASALRYLRETRAPEAPEASRLAERVQGLVSELVSTQNDDGGWPWILPAGNQTRPASDRMASAHVAVALRAAWSVGLMTDPTTPDKAVAYLAREFNRAGADNEARATVLHALGAWEKATFEQANSLARARTSLNNASLAYLALTLADLDRVTLAGEILDILATRAADEPVPPGGKPRKYWPAKGQGPWHRDDAVTTALASLAFSRARPTSPEVAASAEWLLAHRAGDGWRAPKSRGPAVAALAAYFGKADQAEDRYRLVVTVNDVEVHRAEIAGPAEGKAIAVPRKALKVGDANRVRFQIEGRGTYGYAATLTGFARDFAPDQKAEGKPFRVLSRAYLPAEPEFDGKPLPTGFNVLAFNQTQFTNTATQVGPGGRARVRIDVAREMPAGQPASERDFLVVEETIPAGTTLIDGSVKSAATSFTQVDNVLTFYYAPDRPPGRIEYDVFGYLPGEYRTLPVKVHGAYDPGAIHLGQPGSLKVRTADEPATDPYRPTPDELFARGKALFDAGRLAEAGKALEELSDGYGLKDEIARQAARMLLTVHIKGYQARKIVQDFEILKEKAPDLVIPFDEVLVVGRAYRDIGEHERAYLVFRAIVEASYLEDAQVGAVLRARGKELDALKFLLDLWRESPDTASIESDLFGLAQLFAGAAGRAITDPTLRADLAERGATRSELLLQSIRLIQAMLVRSPKNPLADEASLALVGDYLELEDFESVVKLSERFARLYPRSTFLDSFQYSEALGRFNLGQYDRAVDVAGAISRATYKDASGVEQPSPNKWEAIYILGQIYDARRQPARAVEFYDQVADRFSDAAAAVKALTRKALSLPEISTVRPGAAKDVPSKVKLDYRNIAEVDVKVYPVDLMRLYLTRRNLDQIAGIDLAGITPLHEARITLGDGADFDEKIREIDLPLAKEGAYLVMARGENLYASGIVLVSPLEVEVLEEADAGRVRVTVRDAKTKAFAPKVQVKVIGTDNPTFLSGQTDLRGVYVAEGVNGQVTAVARKDAAYAFYRGTTRVGAPPAKPAGEPGVISRFADPYDAPNQSLGKNLSIQNLDNQNRQIERLENRYKAGRTGIKAEEAK
ncbi:MG2 domain-containing protein [Tundrisphaera sp. TA3]|uniref:MG2 domain-containing protein n=1 Tax=Tundrisphaera sp. TA3 TaxID=3435775 RepID=UPI003EBDE2BF